MPTLLRKNGFRFFFYSNERNEPPHIHVIGRSGEAKVWLDPVRISETHGLSNRDCRDILQILLENVRDFRERWRLWHESAGE